MSPDERQESFKVTDRRRRSEPDDVPVPDPVRPEPVRSAPPPRPEPAPVAAQDERSLAGLFMMLASSAVVALGEVPDPMSGQRHVDLAQAAELIDLLALLREKTEGNRSPDETQVLEDVIYDLQVRYVNATKRAGSPPAPPRR